MILVALTVMVLFSVSVVAQELWSLEKCINYAFEHNLQIKQSELDVASSNEDLRQSKLNILPSLNGSFSHNFGWGRSYDNAQGIFINENTMQNFISANSNLTLFEGLTQVNDVRKKQLDYLAKKYDSEKIKNDISLNIAASYLLILFNIDLVNNAQRQVEITQEQIDRTKKQVEAGAIARGSLYDIQAQGANEEANLVNAKNKLMLAYLDLMQLLDLEASEEFDIEKPQLEITGKPELLPPQIIYDKSLTLMPEIKSAEYRVKSAERAIAISRGFKSPRLYATGTYGTNYSDQIGINPYQPISESNPVKSFDQQWIDNRNGTLLFGISIPIFNGFQASTNVRKSKIYKETVELNLELEKNKLRKNIESAYADALASYHTYVARKKAVESYRESFSYTQEKFNVGMVNSTDYNVSKIQLSNAEADLASAKYDFIFKTKILDFYLGRKLTLTDIANMQE